MNDKEKAFWVKEPDPMDFCGELCLFAENIIKEAKKPKWIPVSERLPEHGEIILCRLTFNELRILQWDNVGKWWLGYGAGEDWSPKHVSHWMPLPEPPEEDNNG